MSTKPRSTPSNHPQDKTASPNATSGGRLEHGAAHVPGAFNPPPPVVDTRSTVAPSTQTPAMAIGAGAVKGEAGLRMTGTGGGVVSNSH